MGPACATLVAAPPVVAKDDQSSLTIKAWCIHPDLIHREKIIFVPEPEMMHVHGTPFSLDLEEIIHHLRPTLCYRVLIDIPEVEDWHV
jgi:hypothetical protein